MAGRALTGAGQVEHARSLRPDSSWGLLFQAGGWSAVLYVLLVLVPLALVFLAPVPPTEGAALLEYIGGAHKGST